MYRPTDKQVSLFDPAGSLPESAQARLRASWGDAFHREVYPLLLAEEDRFANLYGVEGRPNWSVARMLGILLLQEMLGLTDQAALDQLSFDLRWHRALALLPEDAYLSRRSLVDFRARLVQRDPDALRMRAVFDRVAKTACEQLELSLVDQRLDSTHMVSNIRNRGRRDLFARTLDLFMRMLRKNHPTEVVRLPEALRPWSESDEKPLSAGEANGRLEQLARWLLAVRDAFAGVDPICLAEPYLLIVRLIAEHVTELPKPAPGEGGDPGREPPIEVHQPASPSTSLQSPHDPDAGYGHKGSGYETQIVETCNNRGKTELILDFDVHASGCTDQGKAAEAVERLLERNAVPTRLFVDSGYVSMQAMDEAIARGVDLQGPISQGKIKVDAIGRDAWTVDPDTGRLKVCPQGHPVVRHAVRTNGHRGAQLHAYVDGENCRACPVRDKCLARPPNDGKPGCRHIEDSPSLLRRDQRLAEQKTPEWRTRNHIRAGIEATNSELKRRHGLGRLRVRRAARVRLAVTAKLIGCNVKRWLRARGAR